MTFHLFRGFINKLRKNILWLNPLEPSKKYKVSGKIIVNKTIYPVSDLLLIYDEDECSYTLYFD